MTDKEMIINGVDVSGCEHYEDHTLYDCNETCEINGGIVCTKCKEHPNCYYKQLKRKDKACKEWKEEYRAKVEELNELEEKLLYKEQECKELKKQIIDTNGLRVDAARAKQKAKRYLQKLERIKEIVKNSDFENIKGETTIR